VSGRSAEAVSPHRLDDQRDVGRAEAIFLRREQASGDRPDADERQQVGGGLQP